MYERLLTKPLHANKSFFLFGPRGTGKTMWVKSHIPNGLYIDLLRSTVFNRLFAEPERLSEMIPSHFSDWIIIDEVQKIPALLNEVHRQIETFGRKFVLTGSSTRSLRKKGVNLLAGRAREYHLYPLTVAELQDDFNLQHSLRYGMLPSVLVDEDPEEYLASYVNNYLKEEVKEEGLTRRLDVFMRFLESASFSQGSILNMSAISRDCGISQKVVSNYFDILDDLLIAMRIPVFKKHTKRRLVLHPKFYFFDVGIYRIIKPKGPLDIVAEEDGIALESLFLQELLAINDYYNFKYKIYYWRTSQQQEIDFVLYGNNGLLAFEIKRSSRLDKNELRNLKLFSQDYPTAKCYFIYGGVESIYMDGIDILPYQQAIANVYSLLQK
jgi:predicted AAA+ superfamily ATPase